MDELEAIEILKSNQCRCGNGKQFKTAFCRDCYYSLPPAIKRALYAQVGCGFEPAYELACRTLDEKGKANQNHR